MKLKYHLLLSRLGLIVFGIALSVIVLEILARAYLLLEDQARQRQASQVSAHFCQADPDLEWTHIPFAQGRNVGGSNEFDVIVKLNSQGLNNDDYILEKPAGTFRVLLLGDSFTEAMYVPINESVQGQLEKNLDRQAKELGYDHIEIINGGVSGMGRVTSGCSIKRLENYISRMW